MAGGCRGFGKAFWRRITKRKHIDAEDTSTHLKRCLSTKRLIFIGVGKTVGVGIYVLIGIATQNAGTVLTYLIMIVSIRNGSISFCSCTHFYLIRCCLEAITYVLKCSENLPL